MRIPPHITHTSNSNTTITPKLKRKKLCFSQTYFFFFLKCLLSKQAKIKEMRSKALSLPAKSVANPTREIVELNILKDKANLDGDMRQFQRYEYRIRELQETQLKRIQNRFNKLLSSLGVCGFACVVLSFFSNKKRVRDINGYAFVVYVCVCVCVRV